jgi:hypothetical protein
MSDIDIESYKAQVFGTTTTQSPTPENTTPANVEASNETLITPTAIPDVQEDVPIAASPIPDQETALDDTVYLKTNFGYENEESLKADLAQLKELKERASSPAEIKFANEESKKIHQILAKGDTKSVLEYLKAQELLSNVDSFNDEQKLKLYIKMQNPLFDSELIDDEYSSLYKIDEQTKNIWIIPSSLEKINYAFSKDN